MTRLRILIPFILTILTGLTQAHAGTTGHGIVRIAAANIRLQPSHASELVSQAVMGTPVRLLKSLDGWYRIETPDGYQGYMIANSIQTVDSTQYSNWKKSRRVMYTAPYTGRVTSSRGPVSDIHAGSVMQIIGSTDTDSVRVLLPDGRYGTLPRNAVAPLDSMGMKPVDHKAIIAMARSLMGVSYLWGGTTTAAMDCSGLSKICYLSQGIILLRDASQQAVTGMQLGPDYHDYRQGDLVFFRSARSGKIVHVGIYDRDGLYIHCSGRVRVNSLDPASPQYISANILAGACRIIPGSRDQTPVNRHPMYFDRDDTSGHGLNR